MTGYVEASSPPSLVAHFASSLTCVGVDGVTLTRGGDQLVGASDPGLLALRRAAQSAHLCADVLVSNWDNSINDFSPAIASRLLGSPTNVARVAHALATLVTRGAWSGVTIDLESLSRADAGGLVALAHDLRVDTPANADLAIDVSATTSAAGYLAAGYDLGALSRDARIVLMAYDDHGPTWSGPGPIGPLAWQRASLAALLASVPASQVDLGVAGYGYTWPARHVHAGVTLSDAGARRLVFQSHATARFDATAGEWTARLASGTVVWWSDGRSYRLRVALARAFHLHGLAVWELSSIDSLGP